MSIDILICTIDEGVERIPEVLLPPLEDVRYVVSVQYTSAQPPQIQQEWANRPDVTLTLLPGRGLSRNRNNALEHATADILVIADDDCRYRPEYFDTIREAYRQHPEADGLCFAYQSYEGASKGNYPAQAMSYEAACCRGYYPSSVELTFRRESLQRCGIRFNTRFGLGTERPAGEEDILLTDCQRAGMVLLCIPQVITRTAAVTTGNFFLTDPRLQRTKGAVFRYRFGLPSALWRTLKEGLHHLVYHRTNPLPLWHHMLQGLLQG